MKILILSIIICANSFGQAFAQEQKKEQNNVADSLFAIHYNLGLEYFEQQRYNDAIESYNKAIEYRENDADVYNNRGNAKGKIYQYKEAVADFDKALSLDSKHSLAYSNRGFTKIILKDYVGSVADYNKAIEYSQQEDHELYYFRGEAKRNLFKYKEAIEDYTKTIAINAEYAFAYFYRGLSRMETLEYTGSKDDFTMVIKLSPKNAEAYYQRGNAKVKLNDELGACEDWGKSGNMGFDKAYEMINKYCK